jgi:hypothetical protein
MSTEPLATPRRIGDAIKRDFRRRPRAAAAAIAVFLSPLLALFGYAVVAHRLLSGPRLREWINVRPKSLTMTWDEASSFWPGRIAIQNLTIRGSDRNVEWIVRLADARVEYSVLALASRTFRCTRLRGSGLSFRLRKKLEQDDLAAADVSVLPPIPGFADPPVRERNPAGPRPRNRNPWRVDVRGIRLDDFDDIWIDASHFQGSARVSGSFFLRPGLLAAIGPARVDFERGAVRLGRSPAELTASGSVLVTFAPYEPFAVHGSQVWKKVTGEVNLEAGFDRLEALQYLFRAARHTCLAEGAGTSTIHGTIERGTARGEASVAIADGSVKLEEVALRGDADLSIAIPSWDLADGPLDVSGSRAVFKEVESAGSDESRRWWGQFEVASGRIDSVSSATIRARSRDARPLLAVLGVDLPGWTRGLLSLEDFSATAEVAVGPSFARVKDFEARGGDFKIQGHYRRDRDRQTRSGALLIESGILRVGLDIRTGTTKVILFGPKKWYRKHLVSLRRGGEAG